MSTDLAVRFEADREQLRGVAFRILGSLDDADDAVQRAWLKASRDDRRDVRNLTGWLTTVTARECLDVLRSRKRRGEVALADDERAADPAPSAEEEVVLAESVGRAMLVVLERLVPAERVAFVLHDVFAVPFDEIGAIVGRSPVAAKKLASRARGKVRGGEASGRLDEQRRLAAAFLTAARGGDVRGLAAVLAPDVVRRADAVAVPAGVPGEIRGVDAVVGETVTLAARARAAELALIDGGIGFVVAPRGRLVLAVVLSYANGRIGGYDVVGDPDRLARLTIRLPEEAGNA
ncbi:sigma-70 family RNA polymerase sigma factor [Actinophytocola gossypii]|uniref:Sigma-70 family RNA polymerase sigma factor n=1 Tax=Actinophytocola gossypii TaxID=2812003 RepID=A0ABT2JCK8_9PSEU|nr:sigma-70 family RNA polymerase sigma factor [Actinophytocola gossypii]MCT2585602.1 sigma-70 family RNA polymerase sigma factor [Actinophytocola gossypii]